MAAINSEPAISRIFFYVAITIAVVIVGVMIWGIVEATINFFKKREGKGIVFFGRDILSEKLHGALKGKDNVYASMGESKEESKYVREERDSAGRLISN